MSIFIRVAIVLVTLLYPVGVYFGLQYFDARIVVFMLVLVAALRLFNLDHSPTKHWLWLPLLGIIVLWTWLSNSDAGLKLYPVFVNFSFLVLFAWSLKQPPPMVERFARLRNSEFPPQAIAYMRKVTIVWCVFFFFNALAALSTSLWASDEVWALYNGFIAYVIMASVFAIEWLVRLWIMRLEDE
ncbi:hypothetical protein NBRC116493_08180 [Aurantivibrio infirmus]